jgi:sec-independent protein translocase protein TatB
MFDISWTEFLLIGVVALMVIGPKELPGVMRTLGQWTRKIRSMAADFQNQFQEAMREAEMTDLKKEVDDLAKDIKDYDPLKDVRADVENAGKDIEKSFETAPAPKAAVEQSDTGLIAEAVTPDAGGEAAPAAAAPAPEPVPAAVEPGSTERTG